MATFSANIIVLRLKSMGVFLWDHWGRIFEIFNWLSIPLSNPIAYNETTGLIRKFNVLEKKNG